MSPLDTKDAYDASPIWHYICATILSEQLYFWTHNYIFWAQKTYFANTKYSEHLKLRLHVRVFGMFAQKLFPWCTNSPLHLRAFPPSPLTQNSLCARLHCLLRKLKLELYHKTNQSESLQKYTLIRFLSTVEIISYTYQNKTKTLAWDGHPQNLLDWLETSLFMYCGNKLWANFMAILTCKLFLRCSEWICACKTCLAWIWKWDALFVSVDSPGLKYLLATPLCHWWL